MPAPFNTIDLTTLALKPGEGRRLDLELIPEPLELGGETYDFGSEPARGRLEVSRTASGHAMRLSLTAKLYGQCMRCLAPSEFEFEVESREIDQPGSGDEELASPYVVEDELDISAWAHDAIALAVPVTLLCRPDCAGLCPECGISLNDIEGEHRHEREPDARWAKLRELMD
ncbi:MAG TPA: YceD family protein [Solirubrobacterales bacterium]|nr:YceD family protein [Solirubrobacterales bacterium]